MEIIMSLEEIAAERKLIRREWKRLTERLANLIERNELLDEQEKLWQDTKEAS
jgi:hypothetical protein